MAIKKRKAEKLPMIEVMKTNWADREYCYKAVEQHPDDFQHCTFQDEKLVRRAIFLKPSNMQFVQDKLLTHSLVLNFVKKHPEVIEFVPKRLHTRAIAYEALDQDPNLIYYLGNNEMFQMRAVEKDGLALKFCVNASKKVIKTALRNNGEAVQFVDKEIKDYDDYVVLAVKSNGNALRFIDRKKINERLCHHAINQNAMSLKYVPNELKPRVEERAQMIKVEASIHAINPIFEAAKFSCFTHKENILHFKKPMIDKIMKELNYKNESIVLKIKIFLKRIGLSFVR